MNRKTRVALDAVAIPCSLVLLTAGANGDDASREDRLWPHLTPSQEVTRMISESGGMGKVTDVECPPITVPQESKPYPVCTATVGGVHTRVIIKKYTPNHRPKDYLATFWYRDL